MATKEEILNYVDNTPENSNRNVLSGMLDSYGGGANVLVVPLEVRVVQGDEFQVPYYKSTKTAAEMLAADFVVFTCEVDSGPGRTASKDLCSHMEEETAGEYAGYCTFWTGDNSIRLFCESPSDYPESDGFTPSDDPDAPSDIS